MTLEDLVGRLTTFEPSNFSNFKLDNVESSFKAKFSLKELNEKKEKVKYVSNDSDIDEEDVEQLEAILARRFHKGKGKFKCKLPIICFNCNEVGHVVTRFLEKMNSRGSDKYKRRSDEDNKVYMMMKWFMLQ